MNYITKRPQKNAFYSGSVAAGSYDYFRGTVDLNQPLYPKKLLFRVNGSWENGQQFYDNADSYTGVIAPDLLWNITDRITLNVGYQYFERHENAPAQMKPNIEVVGPAPASGILSGTGILARGTPTALNPIADSRDPGFLSYYPLPEKFNYADKNDWRISKFDTLNAELIVKMGAGWTLRGNFNYNKSSDRQKLTGAAAVNVDVPSSYTALYPGNYIAAATQFANDILNDPNVALLAPHAQINRRQRLQETFSEGHAFQLEAAGNYVFRWGKIKPLIGAYYNEATGVNRIRQTGSNGARQLYVGTSAANLVPNPPPWDLKNMSQFPINDDINFDPASLPLTTYTSNASHDKAAYAVLNTSFFQDRFYAIVGARYNKSDSQTTNYLANAATTNPIAPKFDTSKTTPQAGIGYKILPDMLAYASYSQSYVQNAGYLQVASQPGPPAKPTTSEGYELGVKTDFLDGRISSTISIYQIDQKDRIISFNSFNPSGAVLVTNQQGTLDRSKGIEAEITWSPLDNFQVYASIAENDIRVKKVPVGYEYYLGTHPEATVKTLANLWMRYTVKEGDVKGMWIGLGGNYVGPKAQRVNNPNLFLDDYVLVNAALGYDWEWQNHKFSAVLNWNNITGVEYFPANQQRGIPQRVVVTLTATF